MYVGIYEYKNLYEAFLDYCTRYHGCDLCAFNPMRNQVFRCTDINTDEDAMKYEQEIMHVLGLRKVDGDPEPRKRVSIKDMWYDILIRRDH